MTNDDRMMTTEAPYGSWRSPITADLVAGTGAWRFSVLETSDDALYWVETRPREGGRNVVMKRERGREPADVTPAGFNARTRVHEYGGGAYAVHGSTVFFSNYDDQRVYRQDGAGDQPVAITPEPERPAGARYADGRLTPDGSLIVCVRELHGDGEAVNEIVAVPADGSGAPRVVVSGSDFYSSPRISPDGRKLAWVSWDHPRMPWDGSEVWVAELTPDGSIAEAHLVAGGPDESVQQPEWSHDGVLHFISDRTNWWNLYRYADAGSEAVTDLEAELGAPQWVFGMSNYAFLRDGRIACSYFSDGADHVGLLSEGGLEEVELPYNVAQYLTAADETIFFVAASPTEAAEVVSLEVRSNAIDVIRDSAQESIDRRYVSVARPIEYPTADGLTAHALYYAPHNDDFIGREGEKPPLLTFVHGGPTAHSTAELQLDVQFWTSRGIAVVDVNYGGSTGYGREYRERLKGTWGIVDTTDAINAARHLVDRGEVDRERLAISGGSAGGWTVLCALTFHDVFRAGANYFGVSDLLGFVDDTHKFESRYIHSLVGPWPEAEQLWRDRSPINFFDRLSCPLIVLQGLEDEVVPPSQSELVVEALKKNGLPHAYLAFEGEQHGFRKAENITRALEAELYFYGKVFGFAPADDIEPIEIEGL